MQPRHQQQPTTKASSETVWRSLALLVLLLTTTTCQQAAAQLEPPGTKISELLLKRYLSNEEQAAWLQEYAHKCKNISRVFSIGKSAVQGQPLWVLEVSDKPGVPEPEPNFKYIGNMHGDEPSGRVLLAQFAEQLCAAYQAGDPQARRVVQQMHLFIMPSLNPDGFEIRRRENGHNVDLNRNFPDPIELGGSAAAGGAGELSQAELAARLRKPLPNAEPETRALMDWLLSMQFTASANLHEGAVVANYPFDGYSDHSPRVTGTRRPSPDDTTFVHLAKTYARAHKTMHKSQEFQDGIVNGAQWYPVYGGMQDWTYLAAGCMDITLELSDDKWRPVGDLGVLWEENKDALLALPIAAVLGGARGIVLSAVDGKPLPATIVVEGIARNISANKQFGYYNRPLAPGTYTLTAVHEGFAPQSAQVVIPADGSGATHDFKLTAAAAAAASPWEQQLSVSDAGGDVGRPRFVVLRTHHVVLLALAGLFVCGFGGCVLLRVVQGKGAMAAGGGGGGGGLGAVLTRAFKLGGGGAAGGGGGGGVSLQLQQLPRRQQQQDHELVGLMASAAGAPRFSSSSGGGAGVLGGATTGPARV